MKPDTSPPSAKFTQLKEILYDLDNSKYSQDEFCAALDYIVRQLDPATAANDEQAKESDGQGLQEDEKARIVAEMRVSLRERKLLLSRLLARKRELMDQIGPAQRFSNLVVLFLGKKRYERFVVPYLADMHEEYFAAVKAGRGKSARFIVWRFYAQMTWPLIKIVFLAIKTLFELSNKVN